MGAFSQRPVYSDRILLRHLAEDLDGAAGLGEPFEQFAVIVQTLDRVREQAREVHRLKSPQTQHQRRQQPNGPGAHRCGAPRLPHP